MADLTACIIGSTQLAIECADIICLAGVNVKHIFTDDYALANWATSNSISSSTTDEFVSQSEDFFSYFDFLFSIVNDVIVPKRILDAVSLKGGKAINYHDGPLQCRGVNVTQWALIHGKKSHCVTWHLMEPRVDTGRILAQEKFPIAEKDDLFAVRLQCRRAALESLRHLCVMLTPPKAHSSQNFKFETKPSAFCLLPFSLPAAGVWNFFRGTYTLDHLYQENALGLPKVCLPPFNVPFIVKSLDIDSTMSGMPPGTVFSVGVNGIMVASSDVSVVISSLVRMDGQDVLKPFSKTFPSLQGCCVDIASAHDNSSVFFNFSRLAGKYEKEWLKNRLKEATLPALSWPYRRNGLKKSEVQSILPQETVNILTIEVSSLQWLLELLNEKDCGSTELAVLAVFLIYILLLSPSLSGSLDAYCNNLPKEYAGYLLTFLPVSFELSPHQSFRDSFSAVYKLLEKAINGRLKDGIREDLLCADVYLRHANDSVGTKNALAISAFNNYEELKDITTKTHDIILLCKFLPGDNTASIVAKVSQGSYHKYCFTAVSANFCAFLSSAVTNPLVLLECLNLTSSHGNQLSDSSIEGEKVEYHVKAACKPIEDQALKFPHVVAVIDDVSSHTYGDILRRSNDISCFLLQHFSSGKNLVIGLLLDRTWEFIAAFLGVLRIGACFAMLEPNHPPKTLAKLLKSSKALAVVVDDVGLKHIEVLSAEEEHFKEVPELLKIKLFYLGSIPATKKYSEPAVCTDAAITVFTSGTTGSPKGAIIRHSSLCNYMSHIIREFDLKPTEIVNDAIVVNEYSLAHTSFNFDGSLHEIIPILWIGGTILFRSTNPAKKSKLGCFTHCVTYLFSQPTKLTVFKPSCFCCVRNLSVGGEPFASELLKPWYTANRSIWNVYGPCETTIGCTLGRLKEDEDICLGCPIANVSLKVLNAWKQTLPLGVAGELHVGGAGVSLGYTDSKSSFWLDSLGNTWYKSGDLVWLDYNRRLCFLSRIPKDRQAKLNGIRFEPAGIEYVLRKIAYVQFAFVEIVTLSTKAEQLIAVIAPENLNVKIIREALKNELPSYLIPSLIVPISFSNIRFTHSGKVDTIEIMKSLTFSTSVQPATEFEEKVMKEYVRVLDTQKGMFGMTSSFTEFGGNSISVVRLASALSTLLEFEISPHDIVETQSPSTLLKMFKARINKHVCAPISINEASRLHSFFQDALLSVNSKIVGPTYNAAYILEVSENVNALRLGSSLEVAIEHFNTAFVGKYKAASQVHVVYTDLSCLTYDQALKTVHRDLQLDAVTAVHLSTCPYRCTMYVLGHGYIISIIAHHIVFDQQTWYNFEAVLVKLYKNPKQTLSGTDCDCVPYSQYVSYEQMKANTMFSESKAFWSTLLEKCRLFVDFPTSFPRAKMVKYCGNVYTIALSPQMSSKLTSLCAGLKINVRPIAFFLSMYGLLIREISKQHNFAVGVSTSLRSSSSDMEKVIGLVLTVIPCVFHQTLFEDYSISDFIEQISCWFWKSLDHAHFPFLELVKIWSKGIKYSHHIPQFLYNFVVGSESRGIDLDSDVTARRRFLNTFTAKAEIVLSVLQMSNGGYSCSWEYNTTLFSRSAMQSIAQEYLSIIDRALDNVHSAADSLQKPAILYHLQNEKEKSSKKSSNLLLTKQALLTRTQRDILKKCKHSTVDSSLQWHSTIHIMVKPETTMEHIRKVLLHFPYLSSVIKTDSNKDIFLCENSEATLQVHYEDVCDEDEATGVMYRQWAWPIDLFTGPLFKCIVLNSTNLERKDIFCVSHNILLDEASLYNLTSKLLMEFGNNTLFSNKSDFEFSGILLDHNSKSRDVLKSFLSCQVPLPLNVGPLPKHVPYPTTVTGEMDVQNLSPVKFASFGCLFSATLLSYLQKSCHSHFALLIENCSTSMKCDESLMPFCVDIDPKQSLQSLLKNINIKLQEVYTACANDASYSYWNEVDQSNSICHEVLVKVFSSAHSNAARVYVPRQFALMLTFIYDSHEVLLTSSLTILQTQSAEKAFKDLLIAFKSTGVLTPISELMAGITLPLSITDKVHKSFKSLPVVISTALDQNSNSVALCETSSLSSKGQISTPNCVTFREFKNLVDILSQRISTFKSTNSELLIGILVQGDVALPLCVVASLMTGCPFTVFDISKGKKVQKMLSQLPVSLLLVDSCILRVLSDTKYSDCIECIVVTTDSYILPTFLTMSLFPRNESQSVPHIKISLCNVAFIVFTSGSTGEPKPVPVLNESLSNFLQWFITHSVETESLRWIQFAGHSFDALIQEILTSLLCGGTLILIDPAKKLDMGYTLSLLKWYGVQALSLVPTVLSILLNCARFSALCLPSLQHIFTTGEKLTSDVCSRFFRRFPPGKHAVLLHNWGGPSECCIAIAHCIINEEQSLSEVPYGYTVDNSEVKICNVTTHEPVPLGFPAEIVISGIPVFNGPSNRFFVKDGKKWYSTGDIGYLNSGGKLVFLNRYDQQVKISGQRIDLNGVKCQILNLGLTYLDDIIVDVMDLGKSKLRKIVCFPLVSQGGVSKEKVQSDLASLLQGSTVPLVVQILEKYPLLDSHKINVKSLKEIAKKIAAKPEESVDTVCGVADKLINAVKSVQPLAVLIEGRHTLDELGFNSIMKAELHQTLLDMGFSVSMDVILMSVNMHQLSSKLSPYAYAPEPHLDERKQYFTKAPGMLTAVIGMHIEVAGASDCDEFWDIVSHKEETISHNLPKDAMLFSESEHSAGCYIGSRGILKQKKRFDAALFNILPTDAITLDPQQRHLLHAVWIGLERAGYDSVKFSKHGKMGVFTGVQFPSYIFNVRSSYSNLSREEVVWQNLRDNAALRIGKFFNFRGPCVTVANNCSTFLVAFHYANLSLLAHECDIAVVAAATVSGQESGYLTSEGDIYSKNGHCCPFSVASTGTVMSDGVTVVVLRRLQEALENGDDISCVVRGTSIGSDGSLIQARQLQPSSIGQIEVLQQVFKMSNVEPSSIGLVEAHGTGTIVGDKIELESLNSTFQMDPKSIGEQIPLGSVKGNIGHTGVASAGPSIVKAALALRYSKIPPTINCDEPSTALEKTPFFINTEMSEWNSTHGKIRRALVHSIGAMGTNAAAILEEFQTITQDHGIVKKECYLVPLCISANSHYSLVEYCCCLKKYLEQNKLVELDDVAFTLLHSRRYLPLRVSCICKNVAELKVWLDEVHSKLIKHVTSEKRKCIMFSGQGSFLNYSVFRELSYCLPHWKDNVIRCLQCVMLKFDYEIGHIDLTSLFDVNLSEELEQCLKRAPMEHTLIVTAQISLYKCLTQLGLKADCFVGHSLGEYTAACLAGVFQVEEVLEIVFRRGLLIENSAPTGSMLSVKASSKQVEDLIASSKLEIACINSPQHCVVAGPLESIKQLQSILTEKGISSRLLTTKYSFHHSCMQLLQEQYLMILQSVSADRPIQCNLITASDGKIKYYGIGETVNIQYWIDHLVTPCNFLSICNLLQSMKCDWQCIEIGSQSTLVHFVRKVSVHLRCSCVLLFQPTCSPEEHFLRSLVDLWNAGEDILLHKLLLFNSARRIMIPTYKFDSQEYWIDSSCKRLPDIVTTVVTQHSDITEDGILSLIHKFCDQNILPQDSLSRLSLSNRLYESYNVNVSQLLSQDVSPINIAAYIIDEIRKGDHSQSGTITSKLLTPPDMEADVNMFILNAVGGNTLHSFTPLAHLLSPYLNVYGLYTSTSHHEPKTLSDCADVYLNEIFKIQSTGPFLIGGYSFGAWVAHCIVKRLEEKNETVKLLFMIDPPDIPKTMESFPDFINPFIMYSLESVRSFTHNPVQDTIRQFSESFVMEVMLLYQYQKVPQCVDSTSLIFIAKDRARYDIHSSSSLPHHWHKWCTQTSLKMAIVDGQHSTCISSLFAHQIAQALLSELSACTTISVDRVPVCSPYEITGDWRLDTFKFHGDASVLSDIHKLSGFLRLSSEKQYTCLVPQLQNMTALKLSAEVALLNSCGYFAIRTPIPGTFTFTLESSVTSSVSVNVNMLIRDHYLVFSMENITIDWKRQLKQ